VISILRTWVAPTKTHYFILKIHNILGSFILLLFSYSATATERVLIYAAASTSSAITEIINQFNKATPTINVKASFASSSTLAKQIEAGAPAHIFISASPDWMDYLQARQLISLQSRNNLLRNKIVLVTPKSNNLTVEMNNNFNFSKKIEGKLCLGDTSHVPSGIYAKQALISLAWWDKVKSKIVGSKDARAALALIERGECTAGIVYFTDIQTSTKIKLIAEFPENTHKPVVYPVAAILPASTSANIFINYLSSPQASKIFNSYGFSTN